ncbi:MAG: hypothetical protein Q8J84_00965 [Flavobacteriaceae bacterium]|nr:hypothetical protein [Flavobacteriaceae bacterium]
MKTLSKTFFMLFFILSCSSQEILIKENDTNLFNIFSNLHIQNIQDIKTESDYFAKIIFINSNIEISNYDEGHDKKQYFYFLIADFGEKPEGILFKSKLLNSPKCEIKNINNDIFELNLTFFDDQNKVVTKKFICNSKGVIQK